MLLLALCPKPNKTFSCRLREDGIYESGLLRGDLFQCPFPLFFSLLYIRLSTPVLLLSFSYVTGRF